MTRTILTTAALLLATLTANAAPLSKVEESVASVVATAAFANSVCAEMFTVNAALAPTLASKFKPDMKSKEFTAFVVKVLNGYLAVANIQGPESACELTYTTLLGPDTDAGRTFLKEVNIIAMTRK